jgi:hypothetical protein
MAVLIGRRDLIAMAALPLARAVGLAAGRCDGTGCGGYDANLPFSRADDDGV